MPTLRCGDACFLQSRYSCSDGELVQLSASASVPSPQIVPTTSTEQSVPGSSAPPCPEAAPLVSQYLSNPPYSNYFLSTCHVSAHAVVTSPLASSNLTIIGPRLIVAFPAGNSGVAAFWEPQNGVNGSLSVGIVESGGSNLSQTYLPADQDSQNAEGLPAVGVSGLVRFNSSAILTLSILGSVRTIRDFTEGPSLLEPEIQDTIQFNNGSNGSVVLQRLWLDNVTTTSLGFLPMSEGASLSIQNKTVAFEKGDYLLWTAYNFPQLDQLEASQVLNPASQDLIQQQPDITTSLSFLSYSNKLLAGTWRFLTYFGRDSMIAALLLQPVLSQGQDSAMEAVLGAVLERINRTDGSVCHEETLGDYATYLNQQMNITSTDPSYVYPMIDTDYYLPVLMDRYFLQSVNGSSRVEPLLSTDAGAINPANKNLTWADLALLNAEKIMDIAGRFAADGNQTIENLAHLKSDQIVGQWRDSSYGIGGGRIPYDVNVALMPAALHSISSLAKAGIYTNHQDWSTLAASYAEIWENQTPDFFRVTIPTEEAKQRLSTYTSRSSFPGPNQTSTIDSANIEFSALALQGNNNLSQVQVMHTDDCFRLFLLNGTANDTAFSTFLNTTASNIRRPFPAGLMTDVGLLVANPAFGTDPVYAANWTSSAYHGTVVWGWPQAMMAKGLENQLLRCNTSTSETEPPSFCSDESVRSNVLAAYNVLWDVIEANEEHLSEEVWSWRYEDGAFRFVELGDLTGLESDIRQLWSLAFLAVRRNGALGMV